MRHPLLILLALGVLGAVDARSEPVVQDAVQFTDATRGEALKGGYDYLCMSGDVEGVGRTAYDCLWHLARRTCRRQRSPAACGYALGRLGAVSIEPAEHVLVIELRALLDGSGDDRVRTLAKLVQDHAPAERLKGPAVGCAVTAENGSTAVRAMAPTPAQCAAELQLKRCPAQRPLAACAGMQPPSGIAYTRLYDGEPGDRVDVAPGPAKVRAAFEARVTELRGLLQ